MKLQFVSYDNLDTIRSNLPHWLDKFKLDSSAGLASEIDGPLFLNTKYGEIPDFTLDMSQDKPFLTEATNVERVYGNLKFLSESQASDERLWAGLCLGPFWNYVRYRWEIDKKCTASNIEQHFMFGFGARRSLTRNAMSRRGAARGRRACREYRAAHRQVPSLRVLLHSGPRSGRAFWEHRR